MVGRHVEAGIFLRQAIERDAHLLLIGLGLGFDRHLDHRLRELHAFKDDGLARTAQRIVDGVCATFGATGELTYLKGYPATINDPEQAEMAARVAEALAGPERVDRAPTPMMGAEEFAYMLNVRPGAYIWAGNGGTAGVHQDRKSTRLNSSH